MDYNSIVRNYIVTIITNELTTGRSDNDLIPFTKDEIDRFISERSNKIDDITNTIISEYTADGELELLKEPMLDWICGYLYVTNIFNTVN